MSRVIEENRRAPHRQNLSRRILLSPLGLFYRLWTRSIRFNWGEEERERVIKETKPVIIVLWHNRLFLAGEWQKRFRKKKECYGLISGSRDGSWLELFYGWAGIRSIRGSRNRRGVQSMKELIRKLNQGNDIGITPDGSRGPCYEAKSGALLVAKISQAPIVLLSFRFSQCIRLKSWDRFVIPLPFTKVKVYTKMIEHELLWPNFTIEEATEFINKELVDRTFD